MLKRKLHAVSKINLVLDLLVTLFSFRLAYYVKDELLPAPIRGLFPIGYYWWLLLIIIPVWAFWLHQNRTYLSLDRPSGKGVWLGTAKSVLEGLAIVFAVIFLAKAWAQSRLFILIFGFLNLLLLEGEKSAIYFLVKRWGGLHQEVLIVGTGGKARRLLQVVQQHLGDWGVRIVGVLQPPGENAEVESSSILGAADDLLRVLQTRPIDWVVFAPQKESLELVRRGMALCEEVGVDSSYVLSTPSPLESATPEFEFYDTLPLLTLRSSAKPPLPLLVKEALDKLLSLLLLLLCLPVFGLIAMGIKLSSKGPVLFKQIRCGLGGRKFAFFKFRTMDQGAEELHQQLLPLSEVSGPVFKIKNDPRTTKLGEFLRRSSLDELPQLLNVLRGDMSLVGPRPPLPAEVDQYENWQRRRLSMKPGLTCIWQVSGRCEIDFHKWMLFDLEYIDNWSLWLDLKIALRTIPAVLSARGAY